MITAAQFKRMTGRWPEQDDLDRVNCPYAGQLSHHYCGVFRCCDNPKFLSHKTTCKEAGYGQR